MKKSYLQSFVDMIRYVGLFTEQYETRELEDNNGQDERWMQQNQTFISNLGLQFLYIFKK